MSVMGYHYSRGQRNVLSSGMYGQGLKGAEAERLQGADRRIKQRVHFYVDVGQGITPEAGVGGYMHRVNLANLYDTDEDALRLNRDSGGFNNFESAVIDAGFDGYFTRKHNGSGAAVVLGQHSVPVQYLGQGGKTRAEKVVPKARPMVMSAAERIASSGLLPAGQMSGPRWKQLVSNVMPDEFKQHENSPAWDIAGPMFKSELARELQGKGTGTLYSRRTQEDPGAEEEDALNELGAFDLNGDLTDEYVSENYDEDFDPEDLQNELDEELGQAGMAPKPIGQARSAQAVDFDAVKPAAIKRAGLMAEDAFPALQFDNAGNHYDVAEYTLAGKSYEVSYLGGSDSVKSATGAGQYALGVKANGFLLDGLRGMTRSGAEDFTRRNLASHVLHKSRHDLYTSVDADARKEVERVWKAIAKLPRAFEFASEVKPKGKSRAEVAQTIADQLLDGTKYSMTATSEGGRIKLAISKGGENLKAGEIEQVGSGKDASMVMHAVDLDQGSGAGKPFYQVAFSVADAFDARVEADPAGLLGVNGYRRTEQQFSAALRSGKTRNIQPGYGQRVYGWNAKTKGAEQEGKNLVRLALAAARNAAEFVPEIKDIRYDLGANVFKWQDGTAAEQFITGALKEQDVRAASISRSTLARAAITFQAMRENVDLSEVKAVASPVLYSSRTKALDEIVEQARIFPNYADWYTAEADRYSRLSGRKVSYDVRVADTGDIASMEVDARNVMRHLDDRVENLRQLIKCLKR